MCGFVGFLSYLGDQLDAGTLDDMSQSLSRRGPDEEQIYSDRGLSFVFRRLSIIDVDGGSQPIWNEDESIFVAVNGEIYNHQALRSHLKDEHRFRTASDSEIVLHLYEERGVSALNLLNGIFSIVVWDSRRQELFLARDRLGVKPLYLAELDDGLLFGSELKALLMHPECPRNLDWADFSMPVAQSTAPVSSYVQGIEHLPGGHYLKVDTQRRRLSEAYWFIEEHFTDNPRDADGNRALYESILDDAANAQLMSDVPMGLFLSGGIDSCLLASLMARTNKNLHCFTVVERTTYRAGDVELARQTAESLDLPLHAVRFDLNDFAARTTLTDFENLVSMIESPRFDVEWLLKWELHRIAKECVPDLKVIVLGQGADEFLGGYSNYLGNPNASWNDYIARLKQEIPQTLSQQTPIATRLHRLIQADLGLADGASTYQKQMRLFCNQLQHFNLWHEDRTSSFHGIEARVPYLDHRLVELAASIPEDQQAELFWDKDLLRERLVDLNATYPRDHAKVPFVATDDSSSIHQFALALCRKLYPDFRDKYLGRSSRAINAGECDALFTTVSTTPGNTENAWRLLEAISIGIFDAFIQEPRGFMGNYLAPSRGEYHLVDDDEWRSLASTYSDTGAASAAITWTLSTTINLQADCEILNPLTEAEGSTELVLARAGQVVTRVRIPDEQDWIVMLLDAMGNHRNTPKDVAYWAAKLSMDPNQLVGVLNEFANGGFISVH